VRRAGLDYWAHVRLTRHASWDAFERDRPAGTLRFFTTHAERSYADVRYEPTDLLVFGCESVGLPADIRAAYRTSMHAIPIDSPHVRSLNLATAAAVVLYEARRQLGPLT
jgi:tRNA (cytidine/uridine-2'-O-)-methyltransferase